MSQLAREAAEAADGARRQIAATSATFAALGARLRSRPPAFIATCARGSSDHAATYGKYLLETTVGRAVASLGPSVAIAGRPLALDGALFVAVSQSGRSPDLVTLTAAARKSGAYVVGIVNDVISPLAHECELVIPLGAGPERAVAATKSFLLSCLAFLQLAAAWSDDPVLHDAVLRAPDAFAAAASVDATAALTPLATARTMFTLGRGLGLSAALEIALKLKETCGLHAEAFSAAELRHGPVALVGPGFPVLAIRQNDATRTSVDDAIAYLAGLGATIVELPPVTAPPLLTPLCSVQAFYLALPSLASARGRDADAPPHLAKVTRTI